MDHKSGEGQGTRSISRTRPGPPTLLTYILTHARTHTRIYVHILFLELPITRARFSEGPRSRNLEPTIYGSGTRDQVPRHPNRKGTKSPLRGRHPIARPTQALDPRLVSTHEASANSKPSIIWTHRVLYTQLVFAWCDQISS